MSGNRVEATSMASRKRTPMDPKGPQTREALLALLDELRVIYTEVDAFTSGWTCDASTECCRFGVTGREPYPTPVELALVDEALARRGPLPKRRALPVLASVSTSGLGTTKPKDATRGGQGERRCPLLSEEGRCYVYDARPFGCRTFFCSRARGPAGESLRALGSKSFAPWGRAIADLSARGWPLDSGPRALTRALAERKMTGTCDDARDHGKRSSRR